MSNRADQSDGQLLDAFVVNDDREALETLVMRHASLVLATCRRALGSRQDAEDAFQATILILVTRPPCPKKTRSLGGWLYQVAYRTSLRLAAARRRNVDFPGEGLVSDAPDPFDEIHRRELMRVLDEELSRLPPRYRDAIVLCHLEHKSRSMAAAELGLTVASVKANLVRGRKLLRARLLRRRVFPALALAAAVSSSKQIAQADPLVSATVELCMSAEAAAPIPADLTHLLESGANKMTLSTGIKLAATSSVAALLIAAAVASRVSADHTDGQSVSNLGVSTVLVTGIDDEEDGASFETATSNKASVEYKRAIVESLRLKAESKKMEATAIGKDPEERAKLLAESRQLWALAEAAELSAKADLLEAQARANDPLEDQPTTQERRSSYMIYGPPGRGQGPMRIGDTVRIESRGEAGKIKSEQFTIDGRGTIWLDQTKSVEAEGLTLLELGRSILDARKP